MTDSQNATAPAAPPSVACVLARRCALVAGVFCMVVCGLLIYGARHGGTVETIDSPEITRLRAALVKAPDDAKLKEAIRAEDVRIREKFFQRQSRETTGLILLGLGVVVLLVSSQAAAKLGARVVAPDASIERQPPTPVATPRSRWGVAGLSIVLATAAVTAGMILPSHYGFEPKPLKRRPPAALPTAAQMAANWPMFHGPAGSGIVADASIPTEWDLATGRNILWRSPVPMEGKGSPAVWGDRVFVTGATPRKRAVYCYSADGKMLWESQVAVSGAQPANDMNKDTGYAPSSPAVDGQRVYAIFPTGEVVCLDFDGDEVWSRNLGPLACQYGHSSSVLLCGKLVILQLDQGEQGDETRSALVALDALTGQTVWTTPRPVGSSWATPILARTAAGPQIIAAGNPWVIAYNPDTGAEIWRVKCLAGEVSPSPVYAGGLVFAVMGASGSKLAAIRPDGKGDVTATHIAWSTEEKLPDVGSPVATDSLLFMAGADGTVTCLQTADGKKLWQQEMGVTCWGSPCVIGDKLLLIDRDGAVRCTRAAGKFEDLGKSVLGDKCDSTPAFAPGRMYIRGDKYLLCVGVRK